MKNLKRILSLALASVMVMGMMVVGASATSFKDDEGIENKAAVETMTALGIISGRDDGSFDPQGTVTRAEMAKMIAFALNGGKEVNFGLKNNRTFPDVEPTDWFAEYVEYCVSLGIIGGRSDGTFDPYSNVTGQEAAKMMLVALGYEGCAMVEGSGQVSGRGEIMEVFPPDAKAPYRITFFDDEVESIRPFDTDSQRSFGAGEAQICIPPAAEFCLDGEARQALEHYLTGHGGEGVESFRARYLFELSERGTFANIEAYAGLLPGKTSVLEYAKNPLLLFDGSVRILEEQKKRMESRAAMLQEILVDGGAFGCEAQAWADAESFLEQNRARCLDLEDIRQNKLLAEQTLDFAMRSTVGFGGSLERLAQAAKTRAEAGWQV